MKWKKNTLDTFECCVSEIRVTQNSRGAACTAKKTFKRRIWQFNCKVISVSIKKFCSPALLVIYFESEKEFCRLIFLNVYFFSR